MIRPMLLVSLLLLGCSSETRNPSIHTYALTDGTVVNLKSPGKLVLINYWAIWCAPCRKEVPELNELMHEYSDKLLVIGINYDDAQGNQLTDQMTRLGIEFPNLIKQAGQADPRLLWDMQPVTVLPETLIIGANGNLQQRLIGPQDKASLEVLLEL